MTISVGEVTARVPMWQGASDLNVSPLEGGITNRNYRVDAAGKSFHLRLPGENTSLLGIDREHEYAANRIAGELEVAPEVVYFIRPEGYLVTRFIHGRHIPLEEIREPGNIQLVTETLHKIHALPKIPGVFSAFQVIRNYAEIARQHNVQFPQNFDWLISQMNDAESALMIKPPIQYPCHNDLLNGNFLLAERLFVLDWEYAGMGDIFFDLANFSNNHELSEDQSQFLLECYFGGVTSRHLAHFNIMKIMSDFREAMWGLVQAGISNLDFDFRGYADRHFHRLTENALNPNWEQWLKELQPKKTRRSHL
jgi:thiamine kinase-like enzyme